MAKRLVEIDDELLREAREALGSATIKDTVNAALAEFVHARLRRRHVQRLVRMEGLDLDRPDVMSDAWR
ncbi:MAG TPA: type II toxin-antitoxin system VapB family antitoxin [Candidatus Dormibacteraeota bacterium]|nr:type II toxin-antitoxin system VapB family antitoxin [Candidatus Dormibacteraeota bacterium]